MAAIVVVTALYRFRLKFKVVVERLYGPLDIWIQYSSWLMLSPGQISEAVCFDMCNSDTVIKW